MRIGFLRHGKAVGAGHPDAGSDFARFLSADGVAELRSIARGIGRLEIGFDRIVTSPLVRAVQTAQIVAAGLGFSGPVEEYAGLACGACLRDVYAAVAMRPDAASVLFVGHEPDFGNIVGELIGTGRPLPMEKAGLALVDVAALAPGGGELYALLPPGVTRRAGAI